MLNIDCSYTCHSFPTRWSPYYSGCNNTCWNWHFPIPNGTMRYSSLVTPSYSLSCLTIWEPNGLVWSSITSFFDRSPTRAKVCLAFNICSFKYYASTFSFICRSKVRCLVISSSYHTCISFILSPLSYNITYLFGFVTSYICPSFMLLVWSYHLWSRYPFALVPLWEWAYSSPQDISSYCHNYWFGKWSTRSKGGFPPFPLSHWTRSGYPLSLNIISKPWWTSSLLTQFA
jgi:hypothetical protein